MSNGGLDENVPVVVLCGGKGTRLREESEFRPKPLVTIGGKPILWHIMKIYATYGFRNFVLCLGYKGEMIKEYFYRYESMNSDFTVTLGSQDIEFHGGHAERGWRITLCDTGMEAMTGARVKRAHKYVRDAETVMLTYGDGVADIDLQALLRFHRSQNAIATVTGVHPSSRFGELLIQDGRVLSFAEKPQVQGALVNGGFFVVQQDFFNYLDESDLCVLEKEPLESLAKDGGLYVYRHNGFWQCMDTYRDFLILNQMWESGESAWRIWE
jgi:glucose-1-phosphate cytidylyltransferase